jgi:hypothetical protein
LIALENTFIEKMKVTDLCSKNIIDLYYGKHHFIAKTGDKKFFYCGQSYHRKSDAGEGMSVHQIIYSNLNCNNNDLDKILNNLSII